MKLSSSNIDLPEGKSDAIFFDSELIGFCLRVRRLSGGVIRRNWCVQYRAHGHARRMIVADAAKVTAKQARERARKLLAEVELGGDPQGDRKERREKDSHSLRGIIDEFIERKSKTVRPNTLMAIKRYLGSSAYLGPLGSMPIDRITKRDCAARVLDAEKRGVQTALCFRGHLSGLFAWAMGAGLCEHNPMIGVHMPEQAAARTRVLSDSELVTIWRGLEDDDFGKITKLVILTGSRRHEIGRMRWSEFSDDMSTWTLPKERSKNARSKRWRPRPLPVTDMMRAIIESVPVREGNDFLFGKKGFSGWSLGKSELDKRIGLSQPWQNRDLRRTMSTKMNDDLGLQPHIVEIILGHILGGIASVYNHAKYPREIASAMALWSDHVASIVEGGERKVVAFEQRAAATP